MQNETKKLLSTLQLLYRSKGIRYADVARHVGTSESTIKRIFKQGNCTIDRLAEMCSLAQLTICDLAELANVRWSEEKHVYTLEQELFLADHLDYLAFFDLLLAGLSVRAIMSEEGLTETDVFPYLRKLEDLGLIERDYLVAKVKVPDGIVWRDDGPLRKKIHERASREFLDAPFSGEAELRRFILADLNVTTHQRIIGKLQELLDDVRRLSRLEAEVEKKGHLATRKMGLFVATRPFRLLDLQRLRAERLAARRG